MTTFAFLSISFLCVMPSVLIGYVAYLSARSIKTPNEDESV